MAKINNNEIKIKNYVVKSNSLVEARYRLSLQESHVILWLLTQIQSDDEDFKPHVLEIIEFARLTGVTVDSRYSELRKITKRLIQRAIEIYDPEQDEWLQVSWLNSARYQRKKGQVSLEFSPTLKPYLLKLKSHFTKIDIADSLKLKSIYAVRIFELLLQYVDLGKRIISLEELRQYCGIEEKEYKNYFDFKTKIIEKAKTEINAKTEYEIDYQQIKESRKVIAIEWTIKKKQPQVEGTNETIDKLQKEYRSELALIEALVEYGFSKAMSKRLMKNNDETVVGDAIKAVNIQVEKGKVRNPKAMIQTAIREQWHPEKFKKK